MNTLLDLAYLALDVRADLSVDRTAREHYLKTSGHLAGLSVEAPPSPGPSSPVTVGSAPLSPSPEGASDVRSEH